MVIDERDAEVRRPAAERGHQMAEPRVAAGAREARRDARVPIDRHRHHEAVVGVGVFADEVVELRGHVRGRHGRGDPEYRETGQSEMDDQSLKSS